MIGSSPQEVLGTIGAIQTLTENFPMGILSLFRGKKYTSVIDFVMDVLRKVGYTDTMIFDLLLRKILGTNNPSIKDLVNGGNNVSSIGDRYHYKSAKSLSEDEKKMAITMVSVPKEQDEIINSPDYIKILSGYDDLGDPTYDYYVKKGMVEVTSDFLEKLEDSVKVILADVLTAVMSCSINPEVPNRYMDAKTTNGLWGGDSIYVPLNFIDIFNLFDLSPTSEVGSNFYAVEDELTVNQLYKTNDLNTFMWYIINRSLVAPQTEINKNMWDSRVLAQKNDAYTRQTSDDWEAWLNSKPSGSSAFTYDDMNEYYLDGENGTMGCPLHPILQFKPSDAYGFNVQFPAQTYRIEEGLFNKTIYDFNYDYLKNIKIFDVKSIITNMINNFLNYELKLSVGLNYSVQQQVIEAKISEVIKRIMEQEDVATTDCFYSFSNEGLSEAMRNTELQKYNAMKLKDAGVPAVERDPSVGLEALNEINSSATINEKISTIKKTVTDLSVTPASGGYMEYSDRLDVSLGYNADYISRFVNALIEPIVMQVMSPKVLLLFYIDFHVMGIIDSNSFRMDKNKVFDFIFKKMITMIASLVTCVKDKVIQILMDAFAEQIKDIMEKYNIVVVKELLESYRFLLAEALAYLPTFDFSMNRVAGQLDEVTYADITKEKTIPDENKTC